MKNKQYIAIICIVIVICTLCLPTSLVVYGEEEISNIKVATSSNAENWIEESEILTDFDKDEEEEEFDDEIELINDTFENATPSNAIPVETQPIEIATNSNAIMVEPDLTITIPERIVIDGRNKVTTYVIEVTGELGENERLEIIPNTSFTMTSINKPDITGEVVQHQTTLDYSELKGTVIIEGQVRADEITAGKWQGETTFLISIKNGGN